MMSSAAVLPLAGVNLLVPFATLRIGLDLGTSREEQWEEPHAVRVVRHDQKVQRAREFRRLATGRGDLFTAREPIGVTRSEPGAERAGVHRERGVEVGVSEQGPRGVVAARVGRVRRLCRECLRRRRRVEVAGVLGVGRRDRCPDRGDHQRRCGHDDAGGWRGEEDRRSQLVVDPHHRLLVRVRALALSPSASRTPPGRAGLRPLH